MIKRNSKFELLRIVSMMMIILSHYELYGMGNSKLLSLRILDPLGQVGVGLFVIISAYFLTAEKNTKSKLLRRILNLWCHVVFYSWLILIFDLFIGFHSIDKADCKK